MKKWHCPLPWNHLATHPSGAVSHCCESDHSNAMDMAFDNVDGKRQFRSLGKNSIFEIMNSDSFQKIRKEFVEGKIPKACQPCYDKEKKGVKSKRQFELEKYGEVADQSIAKVPNFEFIELRMGNLCNLKCRSCNPVSSMKWQRDYDQICKSLDFVKHYNGEKEDYQWPDSKDFWSDLAKHSNKLKTLYINGGEPMLIKKHWHYLQSLIDDDCAKNVDLVYSMNMTLVPQVAFDIWRQFKSIEIKASVDDIEQRNHYIRYPAKWEIINENIQKIKTESWIQLNILQTVSAMNFYYLDEFEQWAQQLNLEVHHNFVYDPDFLSPLALPQSFRKQSLQKLKAGKLSNRLYAPLSSMFSSQKTDLTKWNHYLSYTRELDVIRGQSFIAVFPEVANIFKQLPEFRENFSEVFPTRVVNQRVEF